MNSSGNIREMNMNAFANATVPSRLPVRTHLTGVPPPPVAGSSGGNTLTPSLSEQAQTALATQQLLEQSHAALLARHGGTHELLLGATLRRIMMDVAEHIGREAGTRIMVAEKQCAETKEQAMQLMQRMQDTCNEQVKQVQSQAAMERARGDELEKKLAVASQTIKSLEMKLKGQELQFKQRWEELMDTQRTARRDSIEGQQVIEEKTKSVSIVNSEAAQDKYQKVLKIESEIEIDGAVQASGPEKGARLEKTNGEIMDLSAFSITTTKVSHKEDGGKPLEEVLHDGNSTQGGEKEQKLQLASPTGLWLEEKDCEVLTPPGKATKGDIMDLSPFSITTTKVSDKEDDGGRPLGEVLHDGNSCQGGDKEKKLQLVPSTGLCVEAKDCQVLSHPEKADVDFGGQIQNLKLKEFQICNCGTCPRCKLSNNRGFSHGGKRKSLEIEEMDAREVSGKARKLPREEGKDQVLGVKEDSGFSFNVLSEGNGDGHMCSYKGRQQSTEEVRERMEKTRLEGDFLSKKQGTAAIIVDSEVCNANLVEKHKKNDEFVVELEDFVNVEGPQLNNYGLEDTLENEKTPKKESLQHGMSNKTDSEGLRNEQKGEANQGTIQEEGGMVKLGRPHLESDEDVDETASQEGRRERENLGENSFKVAERKASNIERPVRAIGRTKALKEIMSQSARVKKERKKSFDEVENGGKKGTRLSTSPKKGRGIGGSINSVTVMRKKARMGVLEDSVSVKERANIVSRSENVSAMSAKKSEQSLELLETAKSGMSFEKRKGHQKFDSEDLVVSEEEESAGLVLASMAEQVSMEEAKSRQLNLGLKKASREKRGLASPLVTRIRKSTKAVKEASWSSSESSANDENGVDEEDGKGEEIKQGDREMQVSVKKRGRKVNKDHAKKEGKVEKMATRGSTRSISPSLIEEALRGRGKGRQGFGKILVDGALERCRWRK